MYVLRQTEEFQEWLQQLRDPKARARIVTRLRHVEMGNLGDWRSLGDGVSELRVHYGPGYRLYFTRRARLLVIILAGGTKATQTRDIIRAKRLAKDLE